MSKEDTLNNIKALLEEHFEEYVLILRPNSNERLMFASDETWAKGACERFCVIIDESDRSVERQRWAREE